MQELFYFLTWKIKVNSTGLWREFLALQAAKPALQELLKEFFVRDGAG
jgi:hypothetical protein